ncbi:hypothetical protein GDO86_010964 [Hymenochirus boettgeri]|nr:hypothetical protein GDO86_010964 [Hymenochirus boettgeri]KAG8441986.1 hypothetical protein GDO86_010964 [Hymenochirus boettgeri]
MCEEHEDEKINIYCLNCEVPTCSMCKVFGAHKDCQVAPLTQVFQNQKSELSDGIAILVGCNDRIQAVISQLEETCKTVEENSRRQKEQLCEKFDYLYAILEERKGELTQIITRNQEERLECVRSLMKKYGDHMENVSKLVESGIQFMDEPEMALFLQVCTSLQHTTIFIIYIKFILFHIIQISEATRGFEMEKVESGYENMNHLTVDLNREERIIREIDFYREDEEEEEEEAAEGDESEEVHTESSGEEDTAERGEQIPQVDTNELNSTTDMLSPSQEINPPAPSQPAPQEEVEQSGNQQASEHNIQVLSATEMADPLLYPSWYKGQTQQEPSTDKVELVDALENVGQPVPKEMTVQKDSPAITLKESSAVAGKETSSSAQIPQSEAEVPAQTQEPMSAESDSPSGSKHVFSFSWLNSLPE